MFEWTATLVAEFAGVVLMTEGAFSPGGMPLAVTDKSSIANPWSLPESSGSCHRSQISWPAFTVTVSVAAMAVRLAAALPSSAPAVADAIGPVKLSGWKVVHPVDGVLAPVITPVLATWYWKMRV